MESSQNLSQEKNKKKTTMLAGLIGAIGGIIPAIIMYPSINANRFTSVRQYPLVLALSIVFGAIIGVMFYRTKYEFAGRMIIIFLLVMVTDGLLFFFFVP